LAFFRFASWASSDLYLLDLSPDLKPVAEPKRLTFGNRRAGSPAWTTDGRSLVFSAASSLWRVDASGASKPQRLAGVGENGGLPTISRRGNRLAYARDMADVNIYRIAIPTPGGKASPPQKFISSTREERGMNYSPDGKKIAFLSDRSGSEELWVCDADGSSAVQITSLGGAVLGFLPTWSPDSRRLTFVEKTEGHVEVCVVNASGGSPRRLPSNSAFPGNPSWSKDGRWILFDSLTPTPGIYKVPPEGGPAVLVTTKGGVGPVESPDGKFIYSVRLSADGGTTLLRAPAKGGEAERVFDLRLNDYAIVQDGIYFIPRLDPGDKSDYSIQFFDTTTGKIRRIASLGKSWAFNLAVSPDRRWALYTQLDQGGSDLMLVENFR
jgi:Tol biopolymer transport system component